MKKIVLTLAIVTLFMCLNFTVTAKEISGKKLEQKFLPSEKNDIIRLTWIHISQLQDPTFEYSYSVKKYDPNRIQGTFFDVIITGKVSYDFCISCIPILPFRIFKYIDQEDLGIEVGDTVKISAKALTTHAPAGLPFGRILESGLDISPIVFNVKIEAQN